MDKSSEYVAMTYNYNIVTCYVTIDRFWIDNFGVDRSYIVTVLFLSN